MQTILALSEQTKQETQGYFNIRHNGIADPSGIVKGWAILKAANMLEEAGFTNFYILQRLPLPWGKGESISSNSYQGLKAI